MRKPKNNPDTQESAAKCLTTGFLEGRMPWLAVVASFPGVKTPALAYFCLSVYRCLWMWSLEEIRRIGSRGQRTTIIAT